ncbi:hypothetical protein H4J38_16840, partial [Colwellia sp. BRX10-3]|uniref:hypothetical protein n=1 Tax=Colwellia sp. BRX10-3 TaxID=2759844 RepID=UPI001804D6F9
MYSSRCIYIVACLSLAACGGGSETPKEVINPAPVITAPQSSPTQTVDLSGQAGESLSVVKKVAGVQSESTSSVNTSFSNAIGTLRHASSNGIVEG